MEFNSRRLLFPLNTNITLCSVCHNCIYCIPDEPLSPPPDSPPLYDPLFFPPSLSPPFDQVSEKVKQLSPFLIAIVVILASLFLIASYYVILVKYCSNWRNPRRRSPPEENTHEEFIDENHGPILDHPIWYITTVGLEQSIINAISVYKYKKGEGLVEGTDCSVCLSEFHEDETLRLLPKCSHAFHLPCIDTWLRSHTNCPLCRAPIVINSARPNSTAIVPNPNAVVPNSNAIVPNNLGVGAETRPEISENESGLVTDRTIVRVNSDLEMGLEDDDDEIGLDEGRKDMGLIKEEEPYLQNCEFRVLRDLADNRRVVEGELQLQPVRRSVSLDFSPASMFCFSMANSPSEEGEGSSSVEVVEEKNPNLAIISKSPVLGPTIGRLLQTGPVSMKRSFSSGGKFFLSRNNQNRNSILPL